ncbi:MAG: cytochrome c, partial [Actinobacteria bacterium]|nr:cytochrome c [Actinomycetota bacterium]
MTPDTRHHPRAGMPSLRLLGAAALVALAAAGLVIASGRTAAAQESGEAVYRSICAACHQADGAGLPGVFPPLAGNPSVEDADYVRTVIGAGLSGPLEVNGVAYDGVMPAQSQLSYDDVEAVIAYLQAGLPGAGAAPAAAGDPVLGRELFLGAAGFAHDGP